MTASPAARRLRRGAALEYDVWLTGSSGRLARRVFEGPFAGTRTS
jgi:hypothetical protein